MHYREARFYFFTGTGNSYRVAAWMADAARDEGVNVVLCAIESARPSHDLGTGEAVLLGLVMPTHGFTAPWAMLRFALRLPRRTRTHSLVVATRAGLKIGRVFTPGIEGTATYLIALILALKGYRVRGAIGVDMPSNWIALHPGLSPRAVAAIVARARISVARFIETILFGQRRFVGWGSLVFGLLTLPISLPGAATVVDSVFDIVPRALSGCEAAGGTVAHTGPFAVRAVCAVWLSAQPGRSRPTTCWVWVRTSWPVLSPRRHCWPGWQCALRC